MVGMLPGVESARRRRFHQGGGSMNSSRSIGSRRLSFCLYATGVEPHLNSSCVSRSNLGEGFHGGELGDVAREAKERLDGRLRIQQRSTEIKRHNSMGGGGGGDSMVIGNVQREVFFLKKGTRKLSWSKLGCKASEQSECAVCLENFSTGDILVNLPCAHRFHWNCAMPWLQSSSQCPCCRMPVSSQRESKHRERRDLRSL